MAGPELSRAAISDVLAQSVPVRLLIIGQDCPASMREEYEKLAEADDRVLYWHHSPTLPSLAATWNRALRFVWSTGAEEALVVNNDLRMHADTVKVLSRARDYEQALFVSGVGVTEAQFATLPVQLVEDGDQLPDTFFVGHSLDVQKGGPDFSCFLLSRECHDLLKFDEACTPAYLEDLMCHRELLLLGQGERIFSINLPYWHVGHGSGTLKAVSPERRAAIERQIEQGSRQHYLRCWGGPANHEMYTIKGDPTSAQEGVTTPDLQRRVQKAEADVSL